MPVQVPQALRSAVRARPDGWRLRNVPGGVWGLLLPVGWASVLVISAALQAVFLILVVLSQVPARHSLLFHVLAVLPAFVIGAPAAVGGVKLGWAALRFPIGFHRLDFQLEVSPPRVVAAGLVRRSALRIADLTRVLVRQCDYNERLELVLRTRNWTIVCPATVVSPLFRADPKVLASWLGEVLAPWNVPVVHYHGVFRRQVVRDNWLYVGTVARLWGVPVDDVWRLADRYEIPTCNDVFLDAYAVEEYAGRARGSAETAA